MPCATLRKRMCNQTRKIVILLACGAGAFCICAAQTSGTATIVGLVTDASGAAIARVSIELLDPSSQQVRRQTANEVGQYTVTGLLPGNYRVSASAPGFRQSIVPSLMVDVAKSYVLNFSLDLGAVSDSIEVKAGAAVELQTLDSTVGSVIKGESLLRMPSINRSAMTFFSLQPLVIPTRGQIALSAGQHLTGQVAGARADQSAFTLDGIDATDLTAGTNFYVGSATDFNGPTPMIPVPAEGVEEFRLSTTNSNATYGRSAGGQVSLVTRRGTNDYHGSAYWFDQNEFFNANRWDYNRSGIARQRLRDNRFGGSFGGPVRRNKTFFFANYEGRRLPQTSPVSRLVPSDSLRQGTLKFVDAGGVRSYTMQSFDPRGLGASPVTLSFCDSRNFWTDRRIPPRPQVAGTTGALAVAENFLGQGLDVSAGAARSRVWDNHQYQLRDDFSWVKGKHNIQVGGGWRHIPV